MVKVIGTMVVTLVLALTSHAEATCAWVMWERGSEGRGRMSPYSPSAAVDSRDNCIAEIAKGIAASADMEKALKAAGQRVTRSVLGEATTNVNIVISGEREPVSHWNFICLPDTIDPRGPKGGGR